MKIYQVVENINGKHETYTIGFDTEAELSNWLNGKRLWINERKDSIVAWTVGNCGENYIDLEKIWKRNSFRIA